MQSFAEDVAAVAGIDVVPKILEVICRTTGMGFAAVARVTEDRWIACAVRDEIAFGIEPGGELEVATTLCHEVRQGGRPVLIDHVAEDETYRDHHTPRMYGFQSYVSTPIQHRGKFFGTLCAIDPNPAKVKSPEVLATFELFADLIARHLDVQDELQRSQAALLGERETAELREQFIAVLGHDLRNPLASIDAGVQLLRRTPLNAKAANLAGMMDHSVRRMAGLIDDVLDFARGRLGAGLEVNLRPDPGLAEALEQVVGELRLARPNRIIEAQIDLPRPVSADSRRLGQLLSNLLANALVHGAPDAPVRVQAGVHGGVFELSVANAGEPIDAETLKRLFQPFARAAVRPNQQGLGLGLYIASEIARAHQGEITVTSAPDETRFTFRMPAG